MTTAASEDRRWFWPILFGLLGGVSLLDYFYKFSFQLEDLLQGVGFLSMVPLAYLYPSSFSFRRRNVRQRPAAWVTWASAVGVLLVTAGYAVQWL